MSTPETKSTSISDLPPELLDKIILHILQRAPGEVGNFIEPVYTPHVESDGSVYQSFWRQSFSQDPLDITTTRSASSTSKAFRDSVQDQLFRSAIIPQAIGGVLPAQMLLARSLLERPDLGNKVRRLLIEVGCNSYHGGPKADFLLDAVSLVDTLGLNEARSKDWKQKLRTANYDAFCGVVLALVPNLTSLHIQHDTWPKHEVFKSLFGPYIERYDDSRFGLEGLDTVPGLANIRELRLSVTPPVRVEGLSFLTNIKHLDLTLRTYDAPPASLDSTEMHTDYNQHDLDQFQHIERLSLDCHILTVGTSMRGFLMHLRNLAPAFKNVRELKFYGEPQVYFRHYKKFLPHGYCKDWSQSYEDFYSRADWSSATYDDLFEMLEPLHDSVEILEMPSGFWNLPRSVDIRPVDCLGLFKKLKHLITPKAALLGTVADLVYEVDEEQDEGTTTENEENDQDEVGYDGNGGDNTEHSDNISFGKDAVEDPDGLMPEQDESQDLAEDDNQDSEIADSRRFTGTPAPSGILPRTLEFLKIIDADEACCNWVTGIFCEHDYFRNLAKVELELVEECEADRERLTDMLGAAMDTTILIEVK
jgi:hypothetical protein